MRNASQSWFARRTNQVRWAWLVTTLTLAAALVVGSWVSYRAAVAAVTTLNRGQADLLEFALRELSRPEAHELDAEKLEAFIETHRTAGLRFAAILDTVGRVVLSGGEPAGPIGPETRPTEEEARAHPLISVNGRLRSFFLRPPLFRGPAGSVDREVRRPGPPPSWFSIVEFVPIAPGLVAGARRTLALAAVGAAILTLATLGFWRISRRYDAARQRLEEQRRLTVLGEMSAVLAHEIRNPLASLKGHAQLLTEQLAAGTAERRKADRIVDESKRLESLTSDLLDFARSGPMDLRAVDPGDLLRACAADIAQVEIVVDAARAPESWLLDERRFSQAVLANLLRNAVQASPLDRPPEASVFAENGNLVFAIRDHGPGLPDGDEQRIFDPFFTTRTTGTGLGLPVARRIVELHGGAIVAENAEGGGALFRVILPPSKE